MAMPEASVHLDNRLISWEYKIGRSRKIATVNPKSIAKPVSQPAHDHFGLGVLAPDARHDAAASFAVDPIHH